VSERLATIGVTEYRQLLVADHKLIFYKIEDKKLIILAVMDTRQDINEVLYNALIQY
jgi:plasmid stabilization system protein ParE